MYKKLEKLSEPEKKVKLPQFFQAFPEGYGEGDKFIGVRVPNVRKIAKQYQNIELNDLIPLITNEFHEIRQCAFMILVNKMQKAKKETQQEEIVQFYQKYIEYCNNWDLVDGTAPNILGVYLINKNKDILYKYACSGDLWLQRIAVLSTYYFIKERKFDDTLQLAEILLDNPHDLIHKAVGWMLREIGNRHRPTEEAFLLQNYKKMPRTMLRYSIEKFPQELRQRYLKGLI
ncbi:MAG: DNA alkylation repair protein [Promethearchaeia archaeon]|nr:MAG: DNA alkylation repair protein [Candidatus Lokiarchaeia archaeon]